MLPTLAADWLSDPAWAGMDAMARGFHAHLVLLAARAGGELPDDDALWRRWLGIPEAGAPSDPTVAAWHHADARTRAEALGLRAAGLEDLWERRWAPMVRQAWTAARPGFLTCPAARGLATTAQAPSAPAPRPAPEATPVLPTARRRAPVRGRPDLNTVVFEALLGPGGPVGEGLRVLRPLPDRFGSPEDVAALMHVPVNRAQRLNVWTVGLAVLGDQPSDEVNNRSFLALLIRQYGERKVAAAVGEISGRPVLPADPRSFLRSILRRDTEGSPAAQRARDARAAVPL